MLLIDGHRGQSGWSKYNRLDEVPNAQAWGLATLPEAKLHRIHAYPAKFPGLIADKAFDYAEEHGIKVSSVADVFCGSGTVGLEASTRGASFWGCDINPVATLIAKVKTSPMDATGFVDRAQRVLGRFAKASSKAPVSEAVHAHLTRWYVSDQFADLARLRNAILSEFDGSDASMAMECAFSAIAKPTSQWRARSAKPAFDPDKQAVPVLAAFTRQCALMASAWSDGARAGGSAAEIVKGCATSAGPSAQVDMIVTSPPYATSYEYSDLHQLSALWLGLVDDHRDLRAGSIGTASRRSNLAHAARDLNEVGLQVVFSMFDRDRALAEVLATYFLDMQKVATRCHEIVRPGGLAVFVIGDTRLKGVRINNANHLIESLLEAGFGDVRVTRRTIANKPNTSYRSIDGRLASSPTGQAIYSEEYVLMAHR
ncbi:MAG: class I SAM-dependent methyltransferase [Brevundimonas sp.]|nr:MAG: class I SAM-dependent methyltransferase [Brevundimonas sp.]